MKGTYRTMNEQILPPEDLRERVLEAAKKQRRRRWKLRPLAAAAAALVLVLLAAPVMAAHVPVIEDLMYKIDPQIAARFSPIRESVERNGIRMDVLAASIHENVAEIYLRFTDTSGSGRLGEESVLNTYDLLGKRPEGMGENGDSVAYRGAWGFEDTAFEETTGELYVMIGEKHRYYSEEEERFLTIKECYGDKLTVTVEELWRNVILKEEMHSIRLGDPRLWTVEVARDEAGRERVINQAIQDFRPSHIVAAGAVDPWALQTEYTLIRPGEPITEYPGKTALMGMAYIDGKLHVLARNGESDNVTIRFHLVNPWGEIRNHTHDVEYTMEKGTDKGSYTEYVYELEEAELSRWTLVCTVRERQILKGPWRVTFPLVESDFSGDYQDIIPEALKPKKNAG